MTSLAASISAVALVGCGAMSTAALAGDVSKYREFQLGADMPTVARQAGLIPSQARVIHSRPELIQVLDWRPQALGWSLKTEAAQHVVFTFYNGELFQIVVNYDRDETEGLTTEDLIEAISVNYGTAEKPPALLETVQGRYGDQDAVVARWQDTEHRFDLIRASYGTNYRLIGVLRKLEVPVQAAILEATRLDEQEAPQRNAARVASEEEATKAKLEKARLVNKPKFRP